MVKQIKVLQTLVLFACRFSIDIKVFQTFTPRSAYRRERACPAPCVWIPSALIIPVGQDRQSLNRFEIWRSRTTEVGPTPFGIRSSAKAG